MRPTVIVWKQPLTATGQEWTHSPFQATRPASHVWHAWCEVCQQAWCFDTEAEAALFRDDHKGRHAAGEDFPPPGPPTNVLPKRVREALHMLDSGASGTDVADWLGVTVETIYRDFRACGIRHPEILAACAAAARERRKRRRSAS